LGSRLVVAGAALSILAALIIVEMLLTPSLGKVPERMTSALAALDASLGRQSHVFRIEDEALFYYALVKSLHTGGDYVRTTWEPRSRRSSASTPAPAGNEVREQPLPR
jgi:hypothetical protein